MANSAFGNASMGMQNNAFAPIDPSNPLNDYYAQQVLEHARRYPNDAHAQAQLAHWMQGLAQIQAQRAQTAPGTAPGPMGPAGPSSTAGAAPVPSNIFNPGPVPTPPATTADVRAQGFH